MGVVPEVKYFVFCVLHAIDISDMLNARNYYAQIEVELLNCL